MVCPRPLSYLIWSIRHLTLYSQLLLYFFFIVSLASRATEIYFGTLPVGESRQVTFRLANLSDTHAVKFQWPAVPALTFLPGVGHIKPKCSKTIVVHFKTAKPLAHRALKVTGRLWKISFSKPLAQVPDWDDRMKSVQWVPVGPMPLPPATPPPTVVAAAAAATGLENSSLNSISSTTSKPHAAAPPLKKKVIETEKEPGHQVVEETHTDLELSVTAVADFCKYECPVTDIRFYETLMYQTRAYTFPLKNTGKIQLHFQWSILNQFQVSSPEKETGVKAPFTLTPMAGDIAPDEEVDITVRFSPLEVTEARYILSCQ